MKIFIGLMAIILSCSACSPAGIRLAEEVIEEVAEEELKRNNEVSNEH